MSTSDYLLYTGLFAAILATQLGTRHPAGWPADATRRVPEAS